MAGSAVVTIWSHNTQQSEELTKRREAQEHHERSPQEVWRGRGLVVQHRVETLGWRVSVFGIRDLISSLHYLKGFHGLLNK